MEYFYTRKISDNYPAVVSDFEENLKIKEKYN